MLKVIYLKLAEPAAYLKSLYQALEGVSDMEFESDS